MANTTQLHATDSHLCGLRIWLEPIGDPGPYIAESVRQAQEAFAHMAENSGMIIPELRTCRIASYQDRIAALEKEIARSNREWHAWQERAKAAEAFAKEAQSPPLLAELLEILQTVVGDHGSGEGASDCARRIIKERNQWKAAAQKLVERKLFTAADACNAGLQSDNAKMRELLIAELKTNHMLGEKLSKLRGVVERMLEPCLGEEMRQERMAELREAME